MRLPALIFLALSAVLGAMSLWWFTYLPHSMPYCLIAVSTFIFLLFYFDKNIALHITPSRFFYYLYPICAELLFFIFGFLLCVQAAKNVLNHRIPNIYEGVPLVVSGKIISLPEVQTHSVHFDFLVEDCAFLQSNHASITWPMPEKVHLSWYVFSQAGQPKLMIGDHWRLCVRLKSARSTFNPASFDYEAWLFAHHITALGSVVNQAGNIKFSTQTFSESLLDKWRAHILAAIDNALRDDVNTGVVEALALGVRDHLSAEQWQVMEATGTNHLLAIAGLHIGFVLLGVYALSKWLWRRVPFLLAYFSAHEAALCIAWLVTIYYSMLSGFALPAERAFAMLSVALLASLLRRNSFAWHALAIGLLAVFIVDPLNVFCESFYLSFITVIVIIFTVHGRAAKTHWRQLLHIQWIITLGLIPLTLYFFHQISLLNILVNMIAIPWIAWGALPLILLGIFFLPFSNHLASMLWQLSAKMLIAYWPTLEFFARLERLQWRAFPSLVAVLLAVGGIFFLLLPKGFPCRLLGVFGFFPLIFSSSPALPIHAFTITQLDVGQGLSTWIQTAHHTLVFDTGARLDDHYDMGQSVVVPALLAHSCSILDMLIISHADNDHSGGALAVLHGVPVTQLLTSVPTLYDHLPKELFAQPAKTPLQHFVSWLLGQWAPPKIVDCQAGQSWQWDGVLFNVLGPLPHQSAHSNNNRSCVLHIQNDFHSILLTGDIEKPAEHELLQAYQNQRNALRAEIIVAPHHGSKTSSSEAFLLAVQPKWVFYATGYRNRFHFPSTETVLRYQRFQVNSMDTAKDGQLIAFLPNQNCCIQFTRTRTVMRHFWNF